jgi:integrase
MARTKPKERARSRILTDDELRSVWTTASGRSGLFPMLVQLLLLTAGRRNECRGMSWAEINWTDWTLPAARNKTKVDLVRPLSAAALTLLSRNAAHRRRPLRVLERRPAADRRLGAAQGEIRPRLRRHRLDIA